MTCSACLSIEVIAEVEIYKQQYEHHHDILLRQIAELEEWLDERGYFSSSFPWVETRPDQLQRAVANLTNSDVLELEKLNKMLNRRDLQGTGPFKSSSSYTASFSSATEVDRGAAGCSSGGRPQRAVAYEEAVVEQDTYGRLPALTEEVERDNLIAEILVQVRDDADDVEEDGSGGSGSGGGGGGGDAADDGDIGGSLPRATESDYGAADSNTARVARETLKLPYDCYPPSFENILPLKLIAALYHGR